MSAYKVTAKYVTLRVPDEIAGGEVTVGFYEGAPLPAGVNQEDLARHIRKGMVAEVGSPEADAAVIGGEPVSFGASEAGTPQSQLPPADRPRGNASRADWAAYAASQGAAEDETRPVEEGGLSQSDLRAKYGN